MRCKEAPICYTEECKQACHAYLPYQDMLKHHVVCFQITYAAKRGTFLYNSSYSFMHRVFISNHLFLSIQQLGNEGRTSWGYTLHLKWKILKGCNHEQWNILIVIYIYPFARPLIIMHPPLPLIPRIWFSLKYLYMVYIYCFPPSNFLVPLATHGNINLT
jgi:hypothetical protein